MSTEQRANSLAAESTITRFTALLLPVALGAYLLITSTTDLSDTMWQYDAKRMLQLYLLPFMFLFTLVIPSLRQAFAEQVARIPRWMGWALALMFTLGVISAWQNSTSKMGLAYSLADVALLFLVIAAAFSIAACRTVAGELFDKTLLILVAMVGVAVGLQELIGVLAAWNAGLEFHPRIALQHFSWPRFYNQIQSWTIPVIAALPFFFPRKPLVWLLCLLSLSLHWYVILATGGRGSALAVSCAVMLAVILWPAARKQWALTHLSGLLLGAMIFGLVVLGHGQLQQPEEELANSEQVQQPGQMLDKTESGQFIGSITGSRMTTSSGRTEMWRGSWEDTKAHPWLGIGPMNYACKGPIYRAAHPHSFPMQFVSEWGVPAFLLLLAAGLYVAFKLVLTLRQASPEPNHLHRTMQVALAAGLIAAAIHACLSGVLVMPASQIAGTLISGWLLGSISPSNQPAKSNSTGSVLAANSRLVLVLIISIVFLMFAKHENNISEAQLAATPKMDQLIPRLWQNGKVCTLYQ